MKRPEQTNESHLLRTLLLLVVSTLMLAIALVPLDLKSQILFSLVVFGICLVTSRFNGEISRTLMVALTLLVSTRYIWWRATQTLSFDDAWSSVAGHTLFAAEIYAYFVLWLGYIQTARPLRRQPVPLPEDQASWPTVDVLIPTYNESLQVVAATIAGAQNLEYPKNKLNIYLLDDGNRPEFREYAQKAGIMYTARESNTGAKAGNLNEAFKKTNGELIAIFDCDQIPVRSFLQVAAGWFLKEASLAQLQTPQFFYTPDPLEKNLNTENKVPNESSLFYGLIQDGNDLWDASYFCGSCALLRRSAIENVGGIAEETVTEDAHTSVRLHRKGYTSAYLNQVQSAGLATESLSAHINQRIRWARGLAQVFRIDNPFLGRGLSIGQRLCYANATMHFLYAAPRLVFLLAPLFFLFFDLSIIQSEAVMVAAMALPHIVQSNMTAAKLSGRWRHAFWAEIYETVLSFHILLPTLIALIFPSRGQFNVTRKGQSNKSDYFAYSLVVPIASIGLLNASAVAAGLYGLLVASDADRNTIYLNLFWATYNFIIIGAALGVAREKKQERDYKRHDVDIPASITTIDGKRISARIKSLSISGARVVLDEKYRIQESGLARKYLKSITLDGGYGLMAFNVDCINTDLADLRLAFKPHNVQQLRNVVRILYSPADRWVTAREEFKNVSVLKSLIDIVVFGLVGWLRLLTGFRLSKESGTERDAEQSSKSALIVPTIASVFVLFLSLGYSTTPSAESIEKTVVYELSNLTESVDKPIELGSVRYGFNVPFSIRRDSVVHSGAISLNLSWNDSASDSDREMTIAINDQILWRTDASSGAQELIQVEFDGVLLSDFNTLSFEVQEAEKVACSFQAGDSFELQIHRSSQLNMEVTSVPVANDLLTLPLPFFDDRDPRTAILNFVIPADANPGTLEAAGRIAAWFGGLTSYRGVEFVVSNDSLPGANAIVVASSESLPPSLTWLDAGEPRVLVMDNPVSDDHQLLVLTAPTETGLNDAVESLIASVEAGHLESYLKPYSNQIHSDRQTPSRWVDTRAPAQVSSLVGSTEDLKIVSNNFTPIRIPFNLPGDFHAGDGKPHEFAINYYYSHDFPDFEETMHVSINGVDLDSINLDKHERSSLLHRLLGSYPATDNFEGTLKVDIPHDLVAASNSLEVRFTAPADITSNCGEAGGIEVNAGIDGQSGLDFTNGLLRARYPDLSIFVNSGMPFTQFSDLRETHIELPEKPAPHHYALFLNLLARFAAITGNEPSELSVAPGMDSGDRKHLIVIGSRDQQSRLNNLLDNSPLHLNDSGLSVQFSSILDYYTAVSDWINPFSTERIVSGLRRIGSGNSDGYIISTENAEFDGGVVLLLIADSEPASSALQKTMIDPDRFRSVNGTALVANLERNTSILTGRHFAAGEVVTFYRSAIWWLAEHVLVLLLLAISTAIVISLVLPKSLDQIASRRLK